MYDPSFSGKKIQLRVDTSEKTNICWSSILAPILENNNKEQSSHITLTNTNKIVTVNVGASEIAFFGPCADEKFPYLLDVDELAVLVLEQRRHHRIQHVLNARVLRPKSASLISDLRTSTRNAIVQKITRLTSHKTIPKLHQNKDESTKHLQKNRRKSQRTPRQAWRAIPNRKKKRITHGFL